MSSVVWLDLNVDALVGREQKVLICIRIGAKSGKRFGSKSVVYTRPAKVGGLPGMLLTLYKVL